jgi:EAL domain-containing protein (putative c-di-GMP-specific phosphodiesterase class I)
VLATLHRLRALGVGISLDDYGTGLASLSYVRDLPIDELKIDRSFVQGMTTDRARTLIVVSTVELAHGLGLSVVAEGVEDLATLDALRQHGCDLVQGYLLGPPAPVDALDLTGIGARVPLDRS